MTCQWQLRGRQGKPGPMLRCLNNAMERKWRMATVFGDGSCWHRCGPQFYRPAVGLWPVGARHRVSMPAWAALGVLPPQQIQLRPGPRSFSHSWRHDRIVCCTEYILYRILYRTYCRTPHLKPASCMHCSHEEVQVSSQTRVACVCCYLIWPQPAFFCCAERVLGKPKAHPASRHFCPPTSAHLPDFKFVRLLTHGFCLPCTVRVPPVSVPEIFIPPLGPGCGAVSLAAIRETARPFLV